MAVDDWTTAADWEEQFVTREHELAVLHLERCFDDPVVGPPANCPPSR
jgi:hypothetical protein